MEKWLNLKYFLIAALLNLAIQIDKLNKGQSSIIEAVLAVVVGGFFWGVIATFISNKFKKS